MSRNEYDWNVVVENEEGDEIWDSGCWCHIRLRLTNDAYLSRFGSLDE